MASMMTAAQDRAFTRLTGIRWSNCEGVKLNYCHGTAALDDNFDPYLTIFIGHSWEHEMAMVPNRYAAAASLRNGLAELGFSMVPRLTGYKGCTAPGLAVRVYSNECPPYFARS